MTRAIILERRRNLASLACRCLAPGLCLGLMLCLAPFSLATAHAADIAAKDKGHWVPISDGVLSQVKPGYPGKSAGVTVDPTNGDVFMVVCDQGIWKSSDHGDTFLRVDDKNIGGRCETGFALDFDPRGKRLMCFMIYGGSAFSPDGGQTWQASKVSHLDFGGVDWFATGKALVALRHESGGVLAVSTDAGQTWQDCGQGFTRVGIFDPQHLVAVKDQGILRSADGGRSWTEVSPLKPGGAALRTFQGSGYWVSPAGLLISSDLGATWQVAGSPVAANLGPYFSDDAQHLVVVGPAGFQETTNGGQTWKLAAPLPAGFDVAWVGPNYAWDPQADIFYASSMGKDTLRFVR